MSPASIAGTRAAVADPKHSDHAELIEWYAGCYGDTYQPDAIDELITKRRVAAIAIRRAAGKAAYAKRLNSLFRTQLLSVTA